MGILWYNKSSMGNNYYGPSFKPMLEIAMPTQFLSLCLIEPVSMSKVSNKYFKILYHVCKRNFKILHPQWFTKISPPKTNQTLSSNKSCSVPLCQKIPRKTEHTPTFLSEIVNFIDTSMYYTLNLQSWSFLKSFQFNWVCPLPNSYFNCQVWGFGFHFHMTYTDFKYFAIFLGLFTQRKLKVSIKFKVLSIPYASRRWLYLGHKMYFILYFKCT